jgi:phosphatidylglycerol:prolipoprotein diacylglycerol transferase
VNPLLFGRPELPAYMTLLIIGFALATWLARRDEDRAGKNGDRIVDLAILCAIAGVLGARLLSVLADGHFHDFVNLCVDPKLVPALDQKVAWCEASAQCGYDYLCDTATHKCYPPRDCLAALKFWQGGLAYYGGFLFAVPVGLYYAKRKQLGILRIADVCSPVVAFGLFFGRLGCFLNGCCYGRPTDLPWGVDFPTVAGHVHVHPTQLYESIGCLALFALLLFVAKPMKRRHGDVFAWLLLGYGALRFLLEFLRDDERGALAGLSTSQWIGIPLIAWGVFWLFVRRHDDSRPLVPDPRP